MMESSKHQQAFKALVDQASDIIQSVSKKNTKLRSLVLEYQRWYSAALPVVRQLANDRYDEFVGYYTRPARVKLDSITKWTIKDYFDGVTYGSNRDWDTLASNMLAAQMGILYSIEDRLSSILADITGVLQADLFDNELQVARELRKLGHLRAAGAVAGVVLEGHLRQVCVNNSQTPRGSHPTVATFIEVLKNSDTIDTVTWRWLQRLADIRNLCCHKKEREPAADEVLELIDGVDKALKTVA